MKKLSFFYLIVLSYTLLPFSLFADESNDEDVTPSLGKTPNDTSSSYFTSITPTETALALGAVVLTGGALCYGAEIGAVTTAVGTGVVTCLGRLKECCYQPSETEIEFLENYSIAERESLGIRNQTYDQENQYTDSKSMNHACSFASLLDLNDILNQKDLTSEARLTMGTSQELQLKFFKSGYCDCLPGYQSLVRWSSPALDYERVITHRAIQEKIAQRFWMNPAIKAEYNQAFSEGDAIKVGAVVGFCQKQEASHGIKKLAFTKEEADKVFPENTTEALEKQNKMISHELLLMEDKLNDLNQTVSTQELRNTVLYEQLKYSLLREQAEDALNYRGNKNIEHYASHQHFREFETRRRVAELLDPTVGLTEGTLSYQLIKDLEKSIPRAFYSTDTEKSNWEIGRTQFLKASFLNDDVDIQCSDEEYDTDEEDNERELRHAVAQEIVNDYRRLSGQHLSPNP
ncbi:MAG: hypothetical protein A3F67_01735 [Verrucomicrobia bacterium RIFCSPHIGHO2_12_FULL_41_10]|nr:MAG: hypothetical protein A3F67_01735 [Verrucomicrobia bacterium RIFCSPHIGHO2_12_FULL_41_10]HLB33580.1 hypothetical protein [Chthoniobacterales bacterium]